MCGGADYLPERTERIFRAEMPRQRISGFGRRRGRYAGCTFRERPVAGRRVETRRKIRAAVFRGDCRGNASRHPLLLASKSIWEAVL